VEKERAVGIIGWLLLGLVAGALARLLVPGRDPMGWIGTILLGLVGSFVGGLLAYNAWVRNRRGFARL
jgi:uncharacterized membrane protein YeaQ/YmgE (transglycosylase-associated protein family)